MIQTNLGDDQALTVIATAMDTAGKQFLIGYTGTAVDGMGPNRSRQMETSLPGSG